jgi:FAD-dependent urate hydroxylase
VNNALLALEARVRADLARTAHSDAAWLAPRQAPDGRPALDVLVVGAGQSGLATAFGLMRSQVTNILVLDKSKEGGKEHGSIMLACLRYAVRSSSRAPILMFRA